MTLFAAVSAVGKVVSQTFWRKSPPKMHNALFNDHFGSRYYSKPMFLNRKFILGKSDRLLGGPQARNHLGLPGMFAMRTVDWRASLRSSRLAGAKPEITLFEGERRSKVVGGRLVLLTRFLATSEAATRRSLVNLRVAVDL